MSVVAAILAAGKGERFGSDKALLELRGKALWRRSFDAFAQHPEVDSVGIVGSQNNLAAFRSVESIASFIAVGGETRQESARVALEHAGNAEIILLQDAARPFVSPALISRVIAAVRRAGAAAPGIAVTDSIRRVDGPQAGPLQRNGLVAMQTPQGARVDLFHRAYKEVTGGYTDDISLVETIGVQPEIVEGEVINFKVTTPEDIGRAMAILGPSETRTGFGYDIHPFAAGDPRPLMLGGVEFVGTPRLDGHSDADVLLHAITDSILGAAGLGDIGKHFPNTDNQWKDKPSIHFLKHAGELLRKSGWRILNIDATVIAEFPKIMTKAEAIRDTISEALSLEPHRVSVKATTNEKLGALGRGEGIAAHAVATITEQF